MQTPIGFHFIGNGFTPQMWTSLRSYSDLVADRALRRFPGSEGDLLLRVGIMPNLLPLAQATVPTGSGIDCEISTPNWSHLNVAAVLLLDTVPTAPHPAFPELSVSPRSVVLALTGALANRLAFRLNVPAGFASADVLLQGIALAPSARRGNPLFSTTDGVGLHVLRAQ